MNEIVQTVVAVLRAILRFRWTALLLATVIALAGWAFVHQLPDVYRAQARVFVDSNRVLGPLLKGIAIQADVEQRVSLMSRTLLNRPNLEQLIRDTDLDVTATTELEREQLLDSVRRRIALNGTRGNASLYTVSYQDQERERARDVVQALLTVFIEDTLGDKREDSATAQAFLDKEILSLEQRLARSESRLSDFKRENQGLTPSDSGGYYSRLAQATGRVESARLELAEARNRLQVLTRRAASENPTLRGGGFAESSPTAKKLAEQRQELDDLLLRYTERHPRVSRLRLSIGALEEKVRNESQAPPSERGFDIIASPAYQEIRAQQSEAESSVAGLEVRVAAYERQRDELAETVESIPDIEAQLSQLARDYEIVKGQYETLLERRESARLSDQVEQNVDDIQFRVIDPPFVPVRPSAPRKGIMSAAVLLAGLGAGCAFAFGLSLLRPVYYSPEVVAGRHQFVAFGSVNRHRKSSERLLGKLGWLAYLGWLGLLCALGALVFALHQNMITLDQVERLTGLPLGEFGSALGPALEAAKERLKDMVGRS